MEVVEVRTNCRSLTTGFWADNGRRGWLRILQLLGPERVFLRVKATELLQLAVLGTGSG